MPCKTGIHVKKNCGKVSSWKGVKMDVTYLQLINIYLVMMAELCWC